MQQFMLQECWLAAIQSKPELIIFHPKAYGGGLFAEKLIKRVILALLIPMMVPSAEHPNIGFPNLRLGGWYNRMSYHLVNKLIGVSANRYVKAWRKANDLPPHKRFDIFTYYGRQSYSCPPCLE
jgi:sterol 3beta-glucosyltransferase